MGTYLLSVPRTEALALPNPVEQTTLEPTPIWITTAANNLAHSHSCTRNDTRMTCTSVYGWITSHQGHLPLLSSRQDLKLCENFSTSRTERQVNAFFIMLCLLTHPTSLSWGITPIKGSACAETWKLRLHVFEYNPPIFQMQRYIFFTKQKKQNDKKYTFSFFQAKIKITDHRKTGTISHKWQTPFTAIRQAALASTAIRYYAWTEFTQAKKHTDYYVAYLKFHQ